MTAVVAFACTVAVASALQWEPFAYDLTVPAVAPGVLSIPSPGRMNVSAMYFLRHRDDVVTTALSVCPHAADHSTCLWNIEGAWRNYLYTSTKPLGVVAANSATVRAYLPFESVDAIARIAHAENESLLALGDGASSHNTRVTMLMLGALRGGRLLPKRTSLLPRLAHSPPSAVYVCVYCVCSAAATAIPCSVPLRQLTVP